MMTPRHLKALYEQGQNITALLRSEQGGDRNTEAMIEIAYDLQAGSYVAAMSDPARSALKANYSAAIAKTILDLCQPLSVMEAGVGEATTLAGVLPHLGAVPAYGFDLSWSRVAWGRTWLHTHQITATLCTGSLLHIPFADNSIDVVYTSHSIEPNGGQEQAILRELYRVTGRYLVLLEPGYELASPEARQRMESHGYCQNIAGTCRELGYTVLEHRLFPFASNPLNPTALTIVQKSQKFEPLEQAIACPRFKTPLQSIDGLLFSPEALVVYPVLAGIPCLRLDNGIVASQYLDIVGSVG